MDFLWSSFAILDSLLFYYPKRFNLHNVWYLGENAIYPPFCSRAMWWLYLSCMCLWLLEKCKTFIPCQKHFKERKHYCGKFSNEKYVDLIKQEFLYRLIHGHKIFFPFSRKNNIVWWSNSYEIYSKHIFWSWSECILSSTGVFKFFISFRKTAEEWRKLNFIELFRWNIASSFF